MSPRVSTLLGALALATAASGVFAAEPPPPSSDDIYRLGREALARGAFETASRLFSLLETEPRFASDARFAYNRGQASRYAGSLGEAVAWYSRYLRLDPNASDARSVRELVAKLAYSAPKALRAEAKRSLEAEAARLRADAELGRLLDDCPRVRLSVHFRKLGPDGNPVNPGGTGHLYQGRAVFWELAAAGSRLWVVSLEPILVPEELGAPLHMALPAGRPFPVGLGDDVKCPATLLQIPPVPDLPADPVWASWRAEVSVELDRTGPPVLLTGAPGGSSMSEVQSGPFDGAVILGRRQRELPVAVTQLAFGPRPAAADARAFAGQQIFAVDLPARDGLVQRWGAPLPSFTVVNAFGGFVEPSPGARRLTARPNGEGPSLVPLALR